MNSTEYQELALRTESPITPELIERLTGNARAVHAFFGLLTETGELADGFKRAIFYGKPLDTTNINEEVGDVLWYLAILIDTLGIDFESCMVANINKLKLRYPTKYSQESALNRDTAAEREALEERTSKVTTTTTVIKPDASCDICEGTGQVGGKDASFNSPPCPKCFPEHKCEHKICSSDGREPIDGKVITTCVDCGEKFTLRISQKLPADWDKDPYSQTNQGWLEPKEEKELPTTVKVTCQNGETKIESSSNPFALARQIADTYAEGQNRIRAMIEIDRAEGITNKETKDANSRATS